MTRAYFDTRQSLRRLLLKSLELPVMITIIALSSDFIGINRQSSQHNLHRAHLSSHWSVEQRMEGWTMRRQLSGYQYQLSSVAMPVVMTTITLMCQLHLAVVAATNELWLCNIVVTTRRNLPSNHGALWPVAHKPCFEIANLLPVTLYLQVMEVVPVDRPRKRTPDDICYIGF